MDTTHSNNTGRTSSKGTWTGNGTDTQDDVLLPTLEASPTNRKGNDMTQNTFRNSAERIAHAIAAADRIAAKMNDLSNARDYDKELAQLTEWYGKPFADFVHHRIIDCPVHAEGAPCCACTCNPNF